MKGGLRHLPIIKVFQELSGLPRRAPGKVVVQFLTNRFFKHKEKEN